MIVYAETAPEGLSGCAVAIIGGQCISAYNAGRLTAFQAVALSGTAAIIVGITAGHIGHYIYNNNE